MYKVIIADDEMSIREGLKNLSFWNEYDFWVAETFSDGDEVVEYLEFMSADVIITDIRMPRKDGIAVAKYVYESELPCKVVFISGYKEFELAVEGMRYGVEDYILKPSVPDEIRKVIEKLKKTLDAEHKENERERKKDSFLEDKFVSELILGGLDNKEYLRQCMNMLYPDIDSDLSPCVLMDLKIENYREFIQNIWNYSEDLFEESIANFLKIADEEMPFYIVYKSKETLQIFGILKKCGADEEKNRNICKEKIVFLVKNLEETFKIKILDIIESIFLNIYQISRNRKKILADRMGTGNIDVQLQEQRKLIVSNIMEGNINVAKRILHDILKVISMEETGYSRNILIDIFSSISQFLHENNVVLFQKIQPYINYQLMLTLPSEEKLRIYCDRIFNRIEEASDSRMDTNSLINQVKAYIEENLFTDISQSQIAERFFLSTAYLSRLFKKQTGEAFLQYVTKKKMEKAAELLCDPQYKVYQISEMLGYKQTRYFSKLFNQYVGYYPDQYRRKVLKIGGIADEWEE